MSTIRAEQLYTDPNLLQQVLKSLSGTDGATVKQAEKILAAFSKNGLCIAALIQQIQACPDGVVQLQAALLLKRKVANLYKSFDQAAKLGLMTTLLNLYASEGTAPKVSSALAGSLSSIAPKVFKENGGSWPDLTQAIGVLSQGTPAQQVLVYELLTQLVEGGCDKFLLPMLDNVTALVMNGCASSDPKVAEKAMGATSSFIRAFVSKPEVMKFQPVLPHMLQVLKQVLTNGDEDFATHVLEVFCEAAESKQPLVNDAIPHLVPIVVQIIQNAAREDASDELVQLAGQTLITFIEARPKLIAKQGLVTPILEALVVTLSSTETAALFNYGGDNQGEGEDEDYTTEQELNILVQATIDKMALHIPSKHFAGPALNHVSSCLQNPDPKIRRGGCAMLGTITEGVCDTIRPMLASILPHVLTAIVDAEPSVRECACFALGQFSEHCQPEILAFAPQIMPPLHTCLQGARGKLAVVVCYVLENFCESLQADTFRPYLSTQMSLLGSLLVDPTSDHQVQMMILSAISASAVASEKDFVPFVDAVVTTLNPLFTSAEKDKLELRGKALECLGHIAVAVGGDHFERFFRQGLDCALHSLTLNSPTLNEYAYLFFANSSKVMGPKMVEFFPQLVPMLVAVASESEITSDPQGDDDEDDNDDDDSSGGHAWINMETGFINSKKAAITALGNLSEAGKAAFVPYLNVVLPALLENQGAGVNSFHAEVKMEALEVLPMVMEAVLHSEGIVAAPEAGVSLTVSQNANNLAMAICAAYLEAMEEESKGIVAAACEGLTRMLDHCGVWLLSVVLQIDPQVQAQNGGDPINVGTILIQSLLPLLDGKAACQQEGADDEEEEDDDDHDKDVIDPVCDCVGALAKAMGPTFDDLASQILPRIKKFALPNRVFTDRIMALGCFGECFMSLGPATHKYLGEVVPLLTSAIGDTESESLRRNGAFCMGHMVSQAASLMQPAEIMALMQHLSPLVGQASVEGQGQGQTGTDADNAVSAACRIIKARPDAVPLESMLPVMLRALPLKADLEEGENIFGVLCSLVDAGNAAALANYTRILEVVAQAALNERMPESTRTALSAWKTRKLADGAYVAAATSLQASHPEYFAFLSR